MLENIIVIKKGGREEPFDVEKLHKVVNFACEGLSGTSPSAVAIGSRTRLQGTEKITTSDITKILIHSASELIDEHSANYQYVAGRLMNYDLRKQVYDTFTVPPLFGIIKKNVDEGWYDKEVLEKYTQEEIDYLDTKLNHHRDETFTYAAWKQLNSKYLVRDRNVGTYKESPQIMYMLIAMKLFSNAEPSSRLQTVVSYYNKISSGHKALIGLPTPILGGVRTPTRQFSSCVVIKSGDSLDSINATSESCVNYVAKRAGIGLDMGRIRPLGSPIRNGEATHTGITPFTKHNQTAVGSASQGGIRSGAATTFFPVFHQEIESIIVFKNNRGTDENRVRHLDYGIAINTHFYKMAIADKPYNLFNANEVPDLYEAFYKDPELFEKLYNKYSKDSSKSKIVVSAKELFDSIVSERAQTGRIYIFNVDNANRQSAFKSTIYQSNLCVAGDTNILTKDGYKPISSLDGQTVDCWNGESWSATPIIRTSDGQEVLTVELTNGATIKATPYHKWYVVKQDTRGKMVGEQMKRTHELLANDKLVKFALEPVTHGTKVLDDAYTNGIFTADGTMYASGHPKVYLYGTKKSLLHRITSYTNVTTTDLENTTRLNVMFAKDALKPKFFIPSSSYSVDSRIEWLSGLLDGDGHLTNNNGTESLQLVSTNQKFLHSLHLMLQELGVTSKVKLASKAGYTRMPTNTGTGESKEYWTQETYRILIAGSSLPHLISLGLSCERVQPSSRKYNREATQFVRVVSVTDNNEVLPTYCGTEPLRNRLMFNGVLTGNCLEISIPTQDITKLGTFKVKEIEQFGMMIPDTKDIKAFHERFGEIGLCTLSNINMGMIRSPSDLEEACKYAVYALDALLDYQDYPLIAAEIPAKSRRNLGLGLNNLAYFLAKNKIKYGESLEFLDEYMEAMYFYSLKASVELAKEKGACEWFHDTIYADGKFIWELRNKNIDDIVPLTLRLDWEGLREDIRKYGVRNSTLLAHMPSESNSLLMNATNGVEPIREKVTTKGNKVDSYKQVVPNVSMKYDILWDIDVMDYLKTMAVIQKWTDQAISANTSYDPEKFADGKIPSSVVKRHLLTAQKLGLKTLYYHNTKVNEYEDDCETCKL